MFCSFVSSFILMSTVHYLYCTYSPSKSRNHTVYLIKTYCTIRSPRTVITIIKHVYGICESFEIFFFCVAVCVQRSKSFLLVCRKKKVGWEKSVLIMIILIRGCQNAMPIFLQIWISDIALHIELRTQHMQYWSSKVTEGPPLFTELYLHILKFRTEMT
jgi:hypothetical protein